METYGLTETRKMPALALRGLVIFPEMMIQFDVGRKKSILALADAMERDQTIFLVAQKDLGDNEPGFKQLYSTGVVAKIKQVVRHSDEGVRLFAEGLYRARLVSLSKEHPFLEAEVEKVEDAPYRETHRTEALLRHTQNVFEEYVRNYAKVPPDIILGVVRQKHCGKLADYIAMNTLLDYIKNRRFWMRNVRCVGCRGSIPFWRMRSRFLPLKMKLTKKQKNRSIRTKGSIFCGSR